MPRVIATVTPEIDDAIERHHKLSKVPKATIIREALKEYLASRGETFDIDVQWGGKRATDKQPA